MNKQKLTLTADEIKTKIAEQQKLIDDYVAEANKHLSGMQGALAVWQHLLTKAEAQDGEGEGEHEPVS